MRTLLANAQYFLTPALALLTAFGLLKGGIWSWSGVFILVGMVVFDSLVRTQSAGIGVGESGRPLGNPVVLKSCLYLALPVWGSLLLALAWRVNQYAQSVPIAAAEVQGIAVTYGITGWQLIGATLSTGVFFGMAAVWGHELGHQKGLSYIVGRWLFSLFGTTQFPIAHVYGHHINVGCPEDDPATCPRGWSLYKFFMLSHLGQSAFVRDLETDRLARKGKSFWNWENRWLRGYAMVFPTIALFIYAGGWIGIVVMIGYSVVAILSMESFNYVQHYGLLRVPGQPIEYRHSWDNDTVFNNALWIEIGRQADHHDRGETHFWDLIAVGAPNTGWGTIALFPVMMVPPLWHAFMRRYLAEWDRDFATPDECQLAGRANRKAGWIIDENPGRIMKTNPRLAA
jgi:alkane 1-monooxygenase